MSTESAKKKLQEAGKSHFFFTFSRLRCRPAWKGKGKAGPHGGSALGRREGPPPPRLALPMPSVQFSSVAQSCLTLCDHMNRSTPRPPCPSPTPGVHPNPCPSSWFCHPTISSSVIPFSSCPQSFPASGSFPMSPMP